jgi:hypothetical protein
MHHTTSPQKDQKDQNIQKGQKDQNDPKDSADRVDRDNVFVRLIYNGNPIVLPGCRGRFNDVQAHGGHDGPGNAANTGSTGGGAGSGTGGAGAGAGAGARDGAGITGAGGDTLCPLVDFGRIINASTPRPQDCASDASPVVDGVIPLIHTASPRARLAHLRHTWHEADCEGILDDLLWTSDAAIMMCVIAILSALCGAVGTYFYLLRYPHMLREGLGGLAGGGSGGNGGMGGRARRGTSTPDRNRNRNHTETLVGGTPAAQRRRATQQYGGGGGRDVLDGGGWGDGGGGRSNQPDQVGGYPGGGTSDLSALLGDSGDDE